MKEMSLLFFILYGLSGLLILIGIFKCFVRERNYFRALNEENFIELNELTVIIPFRNERGRIDGIIHSLNNSKELPSKIIFIDDHSDDETSSYLESNLSIPNFSIIKAQAEGKKHALEQGIQLVSTEFVLTLDADVIFSSNYFSNLERLGKKDMLVLPVIMNGKGWKQIFEMDVDLAGAMNCAVTGFTSPILASGANLLFSKDAYLKFANIDEHSHIASGDDVYLLNNFKKNECSIQLITDPSFSVKTEVPLNLTEYFQQRLRWIKKTGSVKDFKSTFLAAIQFNWLILFWFLIISALYRQEFYYIFQLFAFKVITDLIASKLYLVRIEKGKRIVQILVYQFWMPLVSVVLFFGMILLKPTWKGRKILSR